MIRPRRTKRDANQGEVVDGLRALGASVWDLADVGGTAADLMVCWRGRCRWVEVKQPGKERDLTDGERDCLWLCAQVGVTMIVATCVEDVISAWEGA